VYRFAIWILDPKSLERGINRDFLTIFLVHAYQIEIFAANLRTSTTWGAMVCARARCLIFGVSLHVQTKLRLIARGYARLPADIPFSDWAVASNTSRKILIARISNDG
jgi:hypothetical protein